MWHHHSVTKTATNAANAANAANVANNASPINTANASVEDFKLATVAGVWAALQTAGQQVPFTLF